MPRITISYRREDSGVITGRIFDRLVARYGRDAVFRDIDNIPLGVDFRKHVGQMVDSSNVILAVVGPHWIGPADSPSRLASQADPVRVEVEAAMRTSVPLVPVLVLGATMPDPNDLPESLRDFAYRNAVRIDADQDFDVHMGRLIRAIDGMLNLPSGKSDDAPVAPRKSRWPFVAIGALLAAVIASGVVLVTHRDTTPSPSTAPAPPAKPTGPSQTQIEAERQAYQSAHGNLAALKNYVNSCEACESKSAALGEIRQLEQAAEEAHSYASARGNLAALRGYVTSCQVCEYKAAAQDEINQLERAAQTTQEQQAYQAARGNLTALKSYVNTCQICDSKQAAQSEIDRLQMAAVTPPKLVEPSPPPPPLRPVFAGGTWQGQFFYSNGNAPVRFTWQVRINGNRVSGTSVEPNTFGNASSSVLRANLEGSIDPNGHVVITKTYDGTGGVSHSVMYIGDFDGARSNLTGAWHIGATQGRFAVQASP
jgi:TIR domain-containing protein